MKRYEVVVDGKAHSVTLVPPVVERSKIRATINGREVVAKFSRSTKAELGGTLYVEGRAFHVDLNAMRDASSATVLVDGRPFIVKLRGLRVAPLRREGSVSFARPITVPHGVVVAPIPGRVMSVRVSRGESVRAGQTLVMLEAMKMENEISAPRQGVVRDIWVAEGATVKKDQRLLEIS